MALFMLEMDSVRTPQSEEIHGPMRQTVMVDSRNNALPFSVVVPLKSSRTVVTKSTV